MTVISHSVVTVVCDRECTETVRDLPVGQVHLDQTKCADSTRGGGESERDILQRCERAWPLHKDRRIYSLHSMKLFHRVFMFVFQENTIE